MREFAKKRPWVFGILCAVVGAHLAVVLSMVCSKKKSPLYRAKPLTVHTHYLPKTTVVRRVQTVKKKRAKKPVPRQRKLLRDLEESIAKIERKSDNRLPKQTLQLPQKVDLSREVVEESSYQEQLVGALRSGLKLPSFGNVTLRLRLAKSGAVLGVEVVEAASDENRAYLASNLKTMNFPPFEGDLKQCDEQTFLLTFCSD